MRLLSLILLFLFSCQKDTKPLLPEAPTAYRQTKTITYDCIAANNTLDKFKGILDRKDMMLVSVAYEKENVFR